jgi:hypothetical protein
MSQPPRRIFLGRDSSWAERIRVYRTADAVEVAHITAVEVTLRRVFFDEMQLVTLHRARSSHSIWLLSILTTLCALPTLLVRRVPEIFAAFLAATLLAGISLLLMVLIPAWVVNAFSSRTRVSIRYQFRPGRARAVYLDLWNRAAEAQRQLAVPAAGSPAAGPAPPVAGPPSPVAWLSPPATEQPSPAGGPPNPANPAAGSYPSSAEPAPPAPQAAEPPPQASEPPLTAEPPLTPLPE